ncbi:Tetraspanin [Mactra antiquata]
MKEDIEPVFEGVTINNYDLYALINSLAIIFIVVGAIIILFAILGFIGAACQVQCALVLYAILIAICLGIELAGVILFFVMRGELEDAVMEGMKKSVRKAQEGQEDYLKATQFMFKTYECCHVDNMRLDSDKLGEASNTCVLNGMKYGQDCYESFTDWVKTYQGAFVGVGIAVMIIELLLIILSCWLCRASSKQNDQVV